MKLGEDSMADNNADWVARVTAVVSAVVAVGALYLQHKYAEKEDVSLECRFREQDLVQFDGATLRIPWRCTVANIGFRKLSISNVYIGAFSVAREVRVLSPEKLEPLGDMSIDPGGVQTFIHQQELEAGALRDDVRAAFGGADRLPVEAVEKSLHARCVTIRGDASPTDPNVDLGSRGFDGFAPPKGATLREHLFFKTQSDLARQWYFAAALWKVTPSECEILRRIDEL
jgi:hypothetical protein